MRKDAEAHAEEDLKRKELIEARNQADHTVYGGEKLLRDFAEKIPEEMKTQINDKSAQVKKAIESDNIEEIRKLTEELNQIVQKVGGSMYQQAGPAAGGPGNPGGPDTGDSDPGPASEPGAEDVIDGDFRNA